ncbi:MAG TPA: hypothetical protein VFU19_14085 [Iamia sp.]|nr:hypothetical protein [Iamia sp.]
MRRLLAVALLGVLLVARPVAGQESEGPTLTTDRPAYARGQVIRVEGEGWPSRTLLTIELCGNEAANGSIDCDSRHATTGATTADGRLFVNLLASAPPSPCPCVVHVFSPGGNTDLGVRVRIQGVPEAEVSTAEVPNRRLEVTDVEISTSNRLATWFGAAPRGTMRATVENTGDVPVHDAALRVRWGRSEAGTRTIDAEDLETLEPGESTVVEIPVEMEPLSFGRYVVSAGVAGFSDSTAHDAITAYPLGLILLAVLGVAALVAVRAWRARLAGGEPEPGPPLVAPPPPAPAPAPEPAVDAEGDDDDADDGLRRIPLPVRAGVGVAVVLAVVLTGAFLRGCADDDGGAVSEDDLCEALVEIDPGRAFGGGSAERLAASAVRVYDLQDRVPEEVAGAVSAITNEIDEDPTVLDLPRLEQGDEGYTEAYQAAYALRFNSEVAVAAALLERYAVDECGMAPSGAFDLEAVRASDLDAAAVPVLSQDEIDALRIEFTPADVEGFELKPFEIPQVSFDDDIEGFELEVPEIPQPDLGR